MKTITLFTFVLLLANFSLFAQRTFKVCDVELKKEAFPEFEYIDLLQIQKSNNSVIIAYPRQSLCPIYCE